ncbi:type VI secretion system tip protein VgrG, partial [Pasteurella caecimuris]|uniref:type VI secretion system tip protein TssI/VgrG n=1 Tax=Rodentibacter caecimuris TaxID=1796644 RepID=UPI00215027DF
MAVQSDYRYSLTVNGNSQFDVVSFVLTEHLSSLFRAELALAGFDNAPAFAEILNHPATLTFWQDDTPIRYLNGIVTGFKQQESGFSRTRYQMVIEPALSRANLQADLRIFQQQDSQQIIETLLRKNQVTQHQFHFSDAYWTREYCVQYRETDLAFIERLAAEEGTYYYFEHTADHHILHFSNSSGLAESKGQLLYNAMPAGERPEAAVWHWAYEEKLAGTQQTLRDYTFTHPRYHQEHQAVRNTPNIFGEHRDAQYESYDYPGRYKRDAQGKPFTRYRLEYLQREAELATAKSDDLRVIPGYCFTLTGHRRAHYNRDWLVVGVTHRGWQSGVLEEESGEQGNRYENDIKLIPQGRQWRPTPQPKPRVDGLQVAHVVGPAEEEIYCDEWGRVKVQFPWDRQGNNDEHSSCWIRVSQGWAGAQFGSIAIPRIGHEVLVGFLEGDPDQPIITGRTYHGTTEPPYPLPTHKTRMTIKSKTHKGEGFNELRFDDEKEQEEIFIHAQKNQNNVVNHDETTNVGRNRSEKVGRHEKITVGKNRSQTIKQNELLTVGFNRMTNIAMNELHNVGMMRSLNVLLSQKEMVGQDCDLTVGKDYRIDVGNNTHFSTAQLLTMISQNMHVTGKDEIRLDSKGGQIHLNEKGITLKGIVTIEGPLTVKGEAMAGGRSVEGECIACKQAAAVGRPVNPILGIKLLTNEVDFSLPGLLPLTWRRSYYSDIPAGEMGNWLGQGWRVNGSQWIEGRLQSVALDNPLDTPLNDGQETPPKSTALESFYYLDEQGREIPLPREIDGTPIFIQAEQIWVHYIGTETIEIANTTKSVRMTFRCLPPQTARQRQDGQTSIRYFTLQTIQDNHGNRQQFLYGQGLYGQPPLPYAVTDGNGRVFALQFKHMDATTATASPIAAMASATITPETAECSPLWRLTDIYLLPQPFSAVNLTQLQETLQKHTALSEVSEVSTNSPLGKKLVSYRYNAEGDLIEVKDGLGYVVRKFTYRNHLMVAHEDAAGLVSTYEYDHYRPSGKVIRNSTNLGERWEFAYFPSYTQVTDVLGRTEEYHFDEHRELIKFVAANGQATLQERDKLGRVLSQTDPSGQTRYFEYNPQGQMTKLTRPDNVMLYFMYDNDGRLTGQTDALGNMTRYRYDERGNLVERLDALKQSTAYAYTDKGQLSQITDPLGNHTHFTYDGNAQLAQVTDCSSNPTRFSYNEWGQLSAQTDALGHTTSYDYNDRQQLIAMILPNQSRTTYRYDNAGRMAAVIDPQGNKTAYQYRADGLLCIKTNAQGHRFQYHYDLAGRLVGLTNENQAAYRFVYDESDRVIWEKGFDDKLTQYEYDEQGRLTTQREFGISETSIPNTPNIPNQAVIRETHFHYDRQGRLTKQQIKQGHQQHTTHYRYDANGRLTDIDNGESRLAYRYDALGRLVEETGTHPILDNRPSKIGYHYDANGNRIKTGLPSGDDIHYFYYGTGHLSGIKLNHQLISEITRDKRHREITRTQGRITGEYQYNPLGQLTKQQAGLTESTAIRTLARTFTYDPSGNLQQSDTCLFTGGQFERSQTT